MRQLGELTTAFLPQLLDVIIPKNEQQSVKDLKNIFLIMEFSKDNLRNTITAGKLNMSTQDHIKLIVYNLLCALKVMHGANIIHRDLKPSNILVSRDC